MPDDIAATYEFSTDPARLDRAWVHHVLSTLTYWAAGRERTVQDRVIETSRNYAMYEIATGAQVGYARIVTDETTFAWLADVIIDPAHRRRGLARELLDGILEDLAPMGLKRVVLKASVEGRALYEQVGWESLDGAEDWLELRAR
ncbi:GNAT family N-acetyltransferase [Brachybacterium sacelli]|uniref:Ribosomal protein S18 acetylase RimI-like enzyme n=1 Tax=Brachybacterium sacelli TaxID=173364 RepID=A0ABS4X6V2_9MICO|nr:GNAT family N-acetyltransferase [Brachybacterium sacelli]MBP2384123.1 ribosomal protein S18 acetylase RimI-like enzyme [Brachybacterium sacelli]